MKWYKILAGWVVMLNVAYMLPITFYILNPGGGGEFGISALIIIFLPATLIAHLFSLPAFIILFKKVAKPSDLLIFGNVIGFAWTTGWAIYFLPMFLTKILRYEIG